VRVLQNPFRLDVKGFNLAPGEMVYVNGQQAPKIKFVSGTEVIGKGDTVLKKLVPKGVPVCVQVGVPATPPLISNCYWFKR
jgi:hypothetical protein